MYEREEVPRQVEAGAIVLVVSDDGWLIGDRRRRPGLERACRAIGEGPDLPTRTVLITSMPRRRTA